MHLYTFKARSLAEALRMVREELGRDASVLHTREVGSPLLRWLGGQSIEVTASVELAAPSRLKESEEDQGWSRLEQPLEPPRSSGNPGSRRPVPAAELQDFRNKYRYDLESDHQVGNSLVEQLAAAPTAPQAICFPGASAISDRLRRMGVSESTAARWLQRLDAELACDPECHPDRMLERLRQIIAAELTARIL
jgi:hypothetical protein